MRSRQRDDDNPEKGARTRAASFSGISRRAIGDAAAVSNPVSKRSPVRFTSPGEDEVWQRRVTKLRDDVVAASKRVTQAEADRAAAMAALQAAELERCETPTEIDHALRSRAAECAAVLHVSDRAIRAQMDSAHQLVYSFPQTFAAVQTAEVTTQHASTIVREATAVSEDQRKEYESRCLASATTTTPGRLRTKAREIANELASLTIDERHKIAAAERRVWLRMLDDGMAEIGAVLPAPLALGIKDRIDKVAKSVKQQVTQGIKTQAAEANQLLVTDRGTNRAPGVPGLAGVTNATGATSATGVTRTATTTDDTDATDATGPTNEPESAAGKFGIRVRPGTELPDDYDLLTPEEQATARARVQTFKNAQEIRSLDTYRADAFAEILLTSILGSDTASTVTAGTLAGITANIQLIIPADGGTAQLDGYGPIDAVTARQFTAVAPGWDRMSYNDDGALLSTDRRQPTEPMKRILEARDSRCRFPGCHTLTASCEIDHTIDWALGGPTTISNLGFLCKLHHGLKHPKIPDQCRWNATQDTRGVYTWTAPNGETYVDNPEHPFDTSAFAAKQNFQQDVNLEPTTGGDAANSNDRLDVHDCGTSSPVFDDEPF